MPATLSGFSILKRIALCSLFCLSSCSDLFVQEEWVDASYLASSKVATPDSREAPNGENLLIGWDFPKSLFDQNLHLELTVRLWSNRETVYRIPVERKRDATSLYFPCSDQVLTYRIDVIAADGRVVETWEHQFWTPLIKLSVSSQPKQGSVIETP